VLESDIESAFCDYAKKKGCFSLKLVILHEIGWPDRTILCPGGKVFFAEFKKPGGRRRARQKYWEEKLTGLGFVFIWPDEIGQAETTLDGILE
jgi:hypothetical protein